MQGLDLGFYETSQGIRRGCILGSSYLHDESYKTTEGNKHYRGVLIKRNVANEWYDLTECRLAELEQYYG